MKKNSVTRCSFRGAKSSKIHLQSLGLHCGSLQRSARLPLLWLLFVLINYGKVNLWRWKICRKLGEYFSPIMWPPRNTSLFQYYRTVNTFVDFYVKCLMFRSVLMPSSETSVNSFSVKCHFSGNELEEEDISRR